MPATPHGSLCRGPAPALSRSHDRFTTYPSPTLREYRLQQCYFISNDTFSVLTTNSFAPIAFRFSRVFTAEPTHLLSIPRSKSSFRGPSNSKTLTKHPNVENLKTQQQLSVLNPKNVYDAS